MDHRMTPHALEPTTSRGAVLTIGFATSVAMWALAYICMLGPGLEIGEVLFGAMLLCLLGGGIAVGRVSGAPLRDGPLVGLLSACINLLIVGSVFSDERVRGTAPVWIGGLFAASIMLATIGAMVGARHPIRATSPQPWLHRFAVVGCVTIFLLLITGGLVTGWQAGLAVPDWPGTFGHNMFLYPITEMTGGKFYEHAHRLYGSLVGLTAIGLVIATWRLDDRSIVRRFTIVILIAVIIQGVMGGLRVTEALAGDAGVEVSVADHETALSATLRVTHGVFAQLVFASLSLLAVMTTPRWRMTDQTGLPASTKRYVSMVMWLVPLIVLQLILGAAFRHTSTAETPLNIFGHIHYTFAAVVAIVAGTVGIVAWGMMGRYVPMIGAAGKWLLIALGLQLLLGIAALVAVMTNSVNPTRFDVIITTTHQANGALMLVIAVVLAAWVRRAAQWPSPAEEPAADLPAGEVSPAS
jgi:cytochrome c oxidase assembly protein subunit 15